MAALWREGEMYSDICEVINTEFALSGESAIKPGTVGYHIKAMLQYWRDQSLTHIDDRQAATLLRYNQIEELATEAYFASCRGKRTTNHEKQIERARSKSRQEDMQDIVQDDKAQMKGKGVKLFEDDQLTHSLEIMSEKIKEYVREEENAAGDPRFLAIMIDINHKRSQLWGLLNKGEQTTSDQEMARLTDEARTERIASVIAQAKSRAQGSTGRLVEPQPLGGFAEGDEPDPAMRAAFDTVIERELEEQEKAMDAENDAVLGPEDEEDYIDGLDWE